MKQAFAAVAVLCCLPVFGQAPEKLPAFTSIEIRSSKPGTDGGVGVLPNGQLVVRAATLLDLIKYAYDVEADVVSGGPAWLDAARFDITTKAPAGTSRESLKLMLQALLADRFKLTVHKADRPMPVFALTLGKRAMKLKESREGSLDCDQKGAGARFTLTCTHMTLKELAPQLRRMGFLDHPVVNMTGLDGAFDFSMTLTLPAFRQRPGASDPDRQPDISVFEAVDKDLGLKLEASTQTMTMLVVDNLIKTASEAIDTTPITKKAVEFEVAEVHASKPDAKPDMRVLPNGQAQMTGMPMRFIVREALNVEDDRIVGLPKWADTEKFDIVAKAPPADLNLETLPAMLRALIVERFKLATHEDVAPVSVLGLTVSKRGIKMKESDGTARSSCKPGAANGKKTITCENTTMAELSERLRAQAPAYIDHTVVDLTGLKGAYDFSFAFTIKSQLSAGQGNANTDGAAATDPNGAVTLFEGIEKDTGIKLELTKHPMPVTVIDHLERTPTEN